MKISEIRALSTQAIITNIFYLGIVMSGGKIIKKYDAELERYCKELARRGVVKDGEELYKGMCE